MITNILAFIKHLPPPFARTLNSPSGTTTSSLSRETNEERQLSRTVSALLGSAHHERELYILKRSFYCIVAPAKLADGKAAQAVWCHDSRLGEWPHWCLTPSPLASTPEHMEFATYEDATTVLPDVMNTRIAQDVWAEVDVTQSKVAHVVTRVTMECAVYDAGQSAVIMQQEQEAFRNFMATR